MARRIYFRLTFPRLMAGVIDRQNFPAAAAAKRERERKEEGGATWHLWTGDFEWPTPLPTSLTADYRVPVQPARFMLNRLS